MFLFESSFVRRASAPVIVVSLFALAAASSVVAQAAGDELARDALARPSGSTLSYGTYLGGSGLYENLTSVATDAAGNVFVTGVTDGRVPVTEGAFQPEPPGGGDAFVAKLDPAGAPVWATYVGGTHGDVANDVAVGPDGTVYVAGTTLSQDFPTTPGALQREFRGQNTGCDPHCYGDAFVTRLSSDGSTLEYSTYLGGSDADGASGVAITATGVAIVAGETSSADFPASQGSFDPTYNVPTCFDMCEADVFVAELNPAGTRLLHATYLGGTSWDSPADVALDAGGNIYVAGSSRSTDLPTTPDSYQRAKNGNGDFDFNGFIAAFEGDLAAARYVTYLGRRSEEHVSGVTVDPGGRA
ncbi:MAG TPA: SBBP repeat-containing protein, partial [Actinomycetota bacterium]|nr:SBBP repeat-containing protein [Actinomycetota bacterium]